MKLKLSWIPLISLLILLFAGFANADLVSDTQLVIGTAAVVCRAAGGVPVLAHPISDIQASQAASDNSVQDRIEQEFRASLGILAGVADVSSCGIEVVNEEVLKLAAGVVGSPQGKGTLGSVMRSPVRNLF